MNQTNYKTLGKQKDETLINLLLEIQKNPKLSKKKLMSLKKQFTKDNGDLYSKSEIVQAFRKYSNQYGVKKIDKRILAKLVTRPVRTLSGVAPVTVLTKPYPCPGRCIFCPNDLRMPKSYLSDEPGAQRAEKNWFDPYLQTYRRIMALHRMGHNIEKIELIILGGNWPSYPKNYQIWFVTRCFEAMNDFGKKNQTEKIVKKYKYKLEQQSKSKNIILTDDPDKNAQKVAKLQQIVNDKKDLYNQTIKNQFDFDVDHNDDYFSAQMSNLRRQQHKNELAQSRCVGMVLETRPDTLNKEIVLHMRNLGATKIQLGIQFLDDKVLQMNQRDHSVKQIKKAFKLLRLAGLKIHVHWMPNLYGSNPKQDKKNYEKLFSSPSYKPDEIKIYPCSLLESAPLMNYYQQGKWKPYSEQELYDVIAYCLQNTPPYCRITRVVRDIPSPDIVAGNKKTNFRQIVTQKLTKKRVKLLDIRSREIRNHDFKHDQIIMTQFNYKTTVSKEVFLQCLAPLAGQSLDTDFDDLKLLGFLRLTLPKKVNYIKELKNCAIIREVHVYGKALRISKQEGGKTQHLGLGKQMIKQALKIAQEKNYHYLAVISAIGTRRYYQKLGFELDQLYQKHEL